jgi:hypothetical protein
MSQNISQTEFDKALQVLETISETFNIDIWIPSAQNYYKFKEIDAKQQKSLLSAAINSSVYNTEFIKSFYKILFDNFLNEDKEILNQFNVFDKIVIALALKKEISEKTKVVFDEKKKISHEVYLDSILEKFKTYQTPQNEVINFQNDQLNLVLEIGLPTIKREFDYENELKRKDKRVDDIRNMSDVQNVVSDAFITETTKYINRIWVNEEEFPYENLDFSKKILIVEKLPSVVIQKILETVGKWKAPVDDILTVEYIDEESEEKTKYYKALSVDSLLFLT